jgi:bisphosphoglycerate-dependent phosphoglycerate mutase
MDIEGLSREEVLSLEVPTGTPIVYERIGKAWNRLHDF